MGFRSETMLKNVFKHFWKFSPNFFGLLIQQPA